jgi:hypothetical protein
MRAAWYDKQGPARELLRVGVMADPTPGAGEVRIRIAASGINPGDIKKRQRLRIWDPVSASDSAQRRCGTCRSGRKRRRRRLDRSSSVVLWRSVISGLRHGGGVFGGAGTPGRGRCRTMFPLSRARASAFRPSRRTAAFIRPVRSKGGLSLCRVAPVPWHARLPSHSAFART